MLNQFHPKYRKGMVCTTAKLKWMTVLIKIFAHLIIHSTIFWLCWIELAIMPLESHHSNQLNSNGLLHLARDHWRFYSGCLSRSSSSSLKSLFASHQDLAYSEEGSFYLHQNYLTSLKGFSLHTQALIFLKQFFIWMVINRNFNSFTQPINL